MKKNGVFLFVISHLVPEIFKIFVLGTVHGCHCPGDMAVRMRKVLARPWVDVRVCHLLLLFFDVIRCDNMEVKTQSREYLCK